MQKKSINQTPTQPTYPVSINLRAGSSRILPRCTSPYKLRSLRAYLPVHLWCVKSRTSRFVPNVACLIRRRANCSLVNSERRRSRFKCVIKSRRCRGRIGKNTVVAESGLSGHHYRLKQNVDVAQNLQKNKQ